MKFIYKIPHGYFPGGILQIFSHCQLLRVERKQPACMDNPKRYIIGQSHDSRGNLANYHVVALWPCIVSGCSRNRLTRILWIEPKR